jgi:hypothetical protein
MMMTPIRALWIAGIPFLFTSLTPKEARLDAERLEALGAALVCREMDNPFKDLRPRADDEAPDTFFHVNRLYGLARGRARGEAQGSGVDGDGSGQEGEALA